MPTKTSVFLFWGTLQTGTNDPTKYKIPELLCKYAGNQWELKVMTGVGLPEEERGNQGNSMCPW